ncbi:MAG: polysaccharide biosynthesis tyrosine autokinase [Muribaculaceae bacterium]|nr:polysaccharide biosynthesis tyrosine autokinase [Muribaculaceae bacterium]
MDSNTQKNTSRQEDITDLNLKEFFKFCLSKWLWIAICVVFAVGIALFYVYRKEPIYMRYEQILVNDQDSNGGIGDISKSFSSLGLFSKNANVYNELFTVTSPAVLYQVADSLQLDMNYSVRKGLRSKTLYGKTLPFRVDMLDIDSQESASFKLKTNPDGSRTLYKFVRYLPDTKIKYKDKIEVPAGVNLVETPIGRIQFSENPKYVPNDIHIGRVMDIFKRPMQTTVERYGLKYVGEIPEEDADIINLTVEDVSVERAVDILNYVLIVYNNDWVADKNKMAKATSAFIDERLKVIESELGVVDQNIAQFMKKTGTPDVGAAIKANLELGSAVEEELIKASNHLSVAKYMQEFLAKNKDITTILPVNLGIESEDVGKQILAYNDLLLARNNILSSSSLSNPLVKNYGEQLEDMRAAIVKSVDNNVSNLQTSVNNLQKEMNKMTANMANVPEKNLPLLSEERQQEVKEALYLFLLQKREENELSMKFAADNIRVITPPVGPIKPVAPKKAIIIIIAFIIGLGSPIVLLYFLEIGNTTVRSKKDLDKVRMPFTGEIPLVEGASKIRKLKERNPLKKKDKEEKPPLAVVEEGKRDVVNEAFRVIRGNIDFMTGKNAGSQVIMLTSFNPGSGKSFIAYNLAMSFCLKGKKVLIIDCDLRHGSASMYVGKPNKGLATYLSDNASDWQSLLVHVKTMPNLSILPVGKIPPNPAELLEDEKLKDLVEEARKEFDVIFLDCPPVNIVVDTQLVASLADRTLFVVRAGLLQKAALKELDEFYQEKKFKNMSIILNGTEAVHSRYYTYGNYQNHSYYNS